VLKDDAAEATLNIRQCTMATGGAIRAWEEGQRVFLDFGDMHLHKLSLN
jgi:hypothetical protein